MIKEGLLMYFGSLKDGNIRPSAQPSSALIIIYSQTSFIMKNLTLMLCFWVCASLGTWAQSTKTVQYESSGENFANPERGWHLSYEDLPNSIDNRLNLQTLLTAREEQSITLVKKRYVMEGLNKQETVPQWILTMLKEDFQTVRQAGMKIMVSFLYTNEPGGEDAPKELILKHIPQLKELLANNSDVLAFVVMGFIGEYGEWHDSTNDLLKMPDMQEVAYAMLDNLPEDRMITVRYPRYKRLIVETDEPLPASRAYDETYRSRIGHHNDCFVASTADYGTYQVEDGVVTEEDAEIMKAYLSAENEYLPQGGETCGLCDPFTDPPLWNDAEYAINLLERLHYSTISHYELFDTEAECSTIPVWMEGGYEDEIRKKLGYRFQLVSAELPTQLAGGQSLIMSLEMSNVGWARPYNPRNIVIVLRNKLSGQEYTLPINPPQDARLWLPGPSQTKTLTASVTLPSDLEQGDYEMLLSLPDPEPSLSENPSYSIRLSNQNVWESTTGYNKLNHTVTVGENTTLPDIVSLLNDVSRFSRLAAALEQTGLDEALAGSGPSTLFAPTNAAFEQLDEILATKDRALSNEELTELLRYHVVPDQLLVSGLNTPQTVETLAEASLRLDRENGLVTVLSPFNKAQIITEDISASNGVVQALDGVMINISGITSFTYCGSEGLSTEDEWIDLVNIGDFNNASGNEGGYGDFTGQTIELSQGQTYALNLTPGYTDTEYKEYWKIYADLNQDGLLDGEGELLFDAGAEQIGPISGSLTIPATAIPGTTRLRVVMKFTDAADGDGAIPGACGTFGYGEVEDYTLKVEGATVATTTGSGLLAEYFVKDKKLTGTPALIRTDSTVNFNWRGSSPDAQLPCNKFSARWTGQVQPEYSEQYTFITRSDDGVRLWVNGERIINNWTNHAVQTDQGKITLQAGQKYDIRLEYYENRGKAVCKLLWRSTSQTRQVIPAARLFTPDASNARGADQLLTKESLIKEDYDADLRVYPNPSLDGVFTVQGVPENSQIRMFDLQGRSISVNQRKINEQQVQLQPNLFTPEGLYVVQIFLPNGTRWQRKVVVGK